jgi:nucleoside-diphosphate-sugar epimerase
MTGIRDGKVLVTGPAGFLGQRVVRRLAETGRPVRALVRPGTPPGALDACLQGVSNPRVEMVPASFSDLAALRLAVDGVDVILHIAASTTGSAASQVANTVVGSDILFRTAVELGTPRVVLVSSFGVMGASQLPRSSVVDESVQMDPHPERRDPYSFAKHRQEALAWKYRRESGLPLVVVRPGPIFGPGQAILGGRVGLSLFGLFLHLGGGNVIPLTYVENCADAVIQAGLVPDIEGEVFCIVDDDSPTSRQLLKRYRRRVAPIRFVRVPFVALRQLSRLNAWYSRRTNGHLPAVFTPYKVDAMWKGQRYSNSKAKRLLHWAPRIPMEEALSATFAVQPSPR